MVEFTTTIGHADMPVLVTGYFDSDHGFVTTFVEAWPAPAGLPMGTKPTDLSGYLSGDCLKSFTSMAEGALRGQYHQHREDMAANAAAEQECYA